MYRSVNSQHYVMFIRERHFCLVIGPTQNICNVDVKATFIIVTALQRVLRNAFWYKSTCESHLRGFHFMNESSKHGVYNNGLLIFHNTHAGLSKNVLLHHSKNVDKRFRCMHSVMRYSTKLSMWRTLPTYAVHSPC